MGSAEKKPKADFHVRLVGRGMRPWAVPMRSLASVLQAVQRLIEQKEDEDSSVCVESAPGAGSERGTTLHLLGVTSGSAAYAVSASDPKAPIKVLESLGKFITRPRRAEWTEATISSLRDLSEVAKSLGCEIEFRQADTKVGILARITPSTYSEISGTAFIHGRTSIYAVVERVGGATKMHCGIRLPDSPRKMVICRVASEELVRDLGQHLYQGVVLTGKAIWLKHNWKLRRMVIESFDPPKTGSAVDALRRAHEAGGNAWDEIQDPAKFIAEIRGL